MSDNWQVGDLALCVKSKFLKVGAVYDVDGVTPNVGWKQGQYGAGLIFNKNPHPENATWYFSHFEGNFVKVTPPQADEFDREVIELMTKKKVDTPA